MDGYQHPLFDGKKGMFLDEGPARAPRLGGPSDVDRMMQLTMTASDENSFVQPSPRKILEDVWPALHRERGMVWIIGPDEGPLEAAALLRITELWYSEDLVLEERGIYVHPHYRHKKGRRAHLLMDACEGAARVLGLPLLIGVLSNQRTEGKIRLYERQFGKPAGAFFLVNARTGVNINAHTGGGGREVDAGT
jgi:GNAT superfamily N-acetyltransferase